MLHPSRIASAGLRSRGQPPSLLTHRRPPARPVLQLATQHEGGLTSWEEEVHQDPEALPRQSTRHMLADNPEPAAGEPLGHQAFHAAQEAVGQLPGHAAHLAEHAVNAVGHLPEHAVHAAQLAEKVAAQAVETVLGPADLGPEAQRHSIREVTRDVYRQVHYFVGFGAACIAGLTVWAAGLPLKRDNPYHFTILLPEAPGVRPGVPVRFKGVTVGAVHRVSVDLSQVSVDVQVFKQDTRIPKVPGTKFELNKTGMLNPECFLDVCSPALLSHDQPASQATCLLEATPQAAGLPTSFRAPSQAHSLIRETVRRARQQQQRREYKQQHVEEATTSAGAHGEEEQRLAAGLGGQAGVEPEGGIHDMLRTAAELMATVRQPQVTEQDTPSGTQMSVRDALSDDDDSPLVVSEAATFQEVLQGARPTQVSACREQGLLVCAGDVVQGHLGGSSDELSRRMVLSNRGPGKVQGIQGVHY